MPENVSGAGRLIDLTIAELKLGRPIGKFVKAVSSDHPEARYDDPIKKISTKDYVNNFTKQMKKLCEGNQNKFFNEQQCNQVLEATRKNAKKTFKNSWNKSIYKTVETNVNNKIPGWVDTVRDSKRLIEN